MRFLGSKRRQTVDRQTKAGKVATFKDGRAGSMANANRRMENGDKTKNLSLGQMGVAMNFKPLGNIEPPSVAGENASTSDYLKDVKEGSQTLLNTKEFAFFSYYQRVRQQLESFWEPGLRDQIKKMLDRGRHIASDKEHATHLLVILNGEGMITQIKIIETSGYVDLDQAAINAFNRAGPFPNPPKGMVEADGTVKVEWEFVLKT
jgi:TonB family protein